jgi:hypothetical protein
MEKSWQQSRRSPIINLWRIFINRDCDKAEIAFAKAFDGVVWGVHK